MSRTDLADGQSFWPRIASGFLDLWKDADTDIPIYQQEKAEYAKLQWLPTDESRERKKSLGREKSVFLNNDRISDLDVPLTIEWRLLNQVEASADEQQLLLVKALELHMELVSVQFAFHD